MMKIKFELLVSATAMITAVAAVVVAILQTKVMHDEAQMEREHAKLSVVPRLLVYTGSHVGDDRGSYRVGMLNQGIGPAVVEKIELSLDGGAQTDWAQIVELGTDGKVFMTGENRNIDGITLAEVPSGSMLPAGDRVEMLVLEASGDVAAILRQLDGRLTVNVCYCSLYDDCWQAGFSGHPKPVHACRQD